MELPKHKKIVLFDGVCNLCNTAVQRIIKRDKDDIYRFASLQSDIGKQLTAERGIDTAKVDSIIMVNPGNAYYIKSTAALEIAKDMRGAYAFFAPVLLYIPVRIRDFVYDLIARNRYKWFGKKDQCMIPTPELKAKFLD